MATNWKTRTWDHVRDKGWFEMLLHLHSCAEFEGHKELARELENIAVNYAPEVR